MHCVAHHDRLPQDEAFGVSGDDEQGGPALKFVRLSGRGQCHCFPGHDAGPQFRRRSIPSEPVRDVGRRE